MDVLIPPRNTMPAEGVRYASLIARARGLEGTFSMLTSPLTIALETECTARRGNSGTHGGLGCCPHRVVSEAHMKARRDTQSGCNGHATDVTDVIE